MRKSTTVKKLHENTNMLKTAYQILWKYLIILCDFLVFSQRTPEYEAYKKKGYNSNGNRSAINRLVFVGLNFFQAHRVPPQTAFGFIPGENLIVQTQSHAVRHIRFFNLYKK